ncbi:protein phosphatase 2C domain-containing protein [Paenibacillus sp. UMB4589-SE434]|uniref:protein phosphatase 2C domain-containing protein n=1 Tax=Paenibacillus sp. UMB4589-SE434 TaxID=3046314 RepID=UPI00254D1A7A|nr:protein phosphatase 2C domain-containing protein [Paenibacillus sp. UMB4589-SE434]MDK8179258.1 protein phosphatase 2C domain-containing protein [Paenibacillus sp. UMB4589-SE434]
MRSDDEPSTKINQMQTVSIVCRKGEGICNEDGYVADPTRGLYVVIDGVSGLTTYRDEKGRTAGAAAAQLVQGVFEEVEAQEQHPGAPNTRNGGLIGCSLLKEMTLTANNRLHEWMIEHGIAYEQPEQRIGAVHAGVLVKGRRVYWIQSGDCMIYVQYKDGTVREITRDGVDRFDAKALTLWMMDEAAWQSHVKTDMVVEQLYHNRLHANIAEGYSVINGDPELEKLLEYGSFPLDGINAIVLISDGIYPWINRYNLGIGEKGRNRTAAPLSSKWISELLEMGIESYVTRLEQFEQSDPLCVNVPRFKCADDKTGIVIRC